MAFSTQKDFFHVPFMNENVEYGCKKACVKLKSYVSTIDDRSWAIDETKQSKFLSDLVSNQIPTRYCGGAGDVGEGQFNQSTRFQGPGISDTKRTDRGLTEQFAGLTAGDSLLQCANVHLAEYQKVMKIKTTLEKQLEISNERLKTANEENKRIREVLASKLDSNTAKDFFNKIQRLTSAGKLGKNEENEMLQIYQKMENMYKSYEILQAENNYLKRLIDKLYARTTYDNIQTKPEESKDVTYLQKEVNKLRKELIMLRQMEDDYLKFKQQTNKSTDISEQDVENIKAIIKERNSLREKCKTFEGLKKQVQDLEKKATDANKEAGRLSSTLNNQSQYIGKMEGEMRNMQNYYEDKCQNACFAEECLKSQIEDLKDELIKAKCQAQKADMLAMEIASLRKELLDRDLALNDYDCQYKQLMDVVDELQSVKLQCLNDNQTQTCVNQTDELAFYTCATLDEIIKELKKKGCFNDDFMAIYGLEPDPEDNKECCREMQRLQQELNEAKKQLAENVKCEDVCADALKRLKDLEAEYNKLLQENKFLNEKLKDGEEKLSNMLKKIENLDKEINRNSQNAEKIGKDLEGTLGLVKDISEVQLKNQQLANAVSAINSRDDQKIIDDLRRQLEEELAKLKKCQQDNARLIEESKERDMELKQLKDLNNKLEAEKAKLSSENEKLNSENEKLNSEHEKYNSENGKFNSENEKFSSEKGKLNSEKDKHIDEQRGKDVPSKYDEDAYNRDDKDTVGKENLKIGKHVNIHKNLEDDIRSITEKYPDKYKDKDLDKNKVKTKDDSKKDSNEKEKSDREKRKAAALPAEKSDKDKAAALDDFVKNKSDTFKLNLQQGCGFQNELRKILEDFIQECGFCFCRLVNPKSKLYIICHKLYHCGINTLSFRELAYLHKKIYARAEQLVPGCLLDMILSDNKEQVDNMLSMTIPRLGGGTEIDFKISDTNITEMDPKCCFCKSELCCNNSDEMLKDKVNKLEKDFEIAREYLEALTNIPLEVNLTSDNDGDSTDTNNDNSTFRATSNMEIVPKSSTSKCLRRIKTRLTKHQDNTMYRL